MAFKKGKSGNPGGRPKGFAGLAKYIQAETKEGRELVKVALSILRGKLKVPTPVGKDALMVDLAPSHSNRMAALEWLADRGFGKAVETVVTHEGEGNPMKPLSTEELKALALANAKR